MEKNDYQFTNFKIHSQYSICEGAVKIDELAEYCKNNKIKAIGLCDSLNLCGALEFAEKISKVGTQPIIGSQINFKVENTLTKFYMRLNSRDCRLLFMRQLSNLKIPLRTSNQPHLETWINGSNFCLPDSLKHKQIYLNGIAKKLWPKDSIGTKEMLEPTPLTNAFDQLGKAVLVL